MNPVFQEIGFRLHETLHHHKQTGKEEQQGPVHFFQGVVRRAVRPNQEQRGRAEAGNIQGAPSTKAIINPVNTRRF